MQSGVINGSKPSAGEIDQIIECIGNKLYSKPPAQKGSDIWGMMVELTRRAPTSGGATKFVDIITNGAANRPPLSLMKYRNQQPSYDELMLSQSPPAIELEGLDITFFYLGMKTGGIEMDGNETTWIESFWMQACKSANAENCRLSDEKPNLRNQDL